MLGRMLANPTIRAALMKQLKIAKGETPETPKAQPTTTKRSTRAQAAAPMRTKSKEEEREKTRTRRVRASTARRMNRSM